MHERSAGLCGGGGCRAADSGRGAAGRGAAPGAEAVPPAVGRERQQQRQQRARRAAVVPCGPTVVVLSRASRGSCAAAARGIAGGSLPGCQRAAGLLLCPYVPLCTRTNISGLGKQQQ